MSTNTTQERSELIQAGQHILDAFRNRKSKLTQESGIQYSSQENHTHQESLTSRDNIVIFTPTNQQSLSPEVDVVPLNTPIFDHQHYSLPTSTTEQHYTNLTLADVLNPPEDTINEYYSEQQEHQTNLPFTNSSMEALAVLKETKNHLDEAAFQSPTPEYDNSAMLEPLATWLQTHSKKNSTLSSISHHTFNLLFNDIHLLRSEFNSLLVEYQKIIQEREQWTSERTQLLNQIYEIEHSTLPYTRDSNEHIIEQSKQNELIHQQWIEWIENEKKHLDSLAQEQQLELQQQEKQQRLALLQETQTLEKAKISLLQEQEAFQTEYSVLMQTQQDLESTKQSLQHEKEEFERDRSEFISWKESIIAMISNEREKMDQHQKSTLYEYDKEREAIAKERDQFSLIHQSLMNDKLEIDSQLQSLEAEKNLFLKHKTEFEKEKNEWEHTKQEEWNNINTMNEITQSSIDDHIKEYIDKGQSILEPLRQEYIDLYNKVIALVEQANSIELHDEKRYTSLLEDLCNLLDIAAISNDERKRHLIQSIINLQNHVQKQEEYIANQEEKHKEYITILQNEHKVVNNQDKEQTWWERLKVLELAIKQLELERQAFEQDKENNNNMMNQMNSICKTILSRLAYDSPDTSLDKMMDTINRYLEDNDSFLFISPINKAVEKKKVERVRFDIPSTPFKDGDNDSSIFKTPMVRIPRQHTESFDTDNEPTRPANYVDRGTDGQDMFIEPSADELENPSYISIDQQHSINGLKEELDRVTLSYNQCKDEIERLHNMKFEYELRFEEEKMEWTMELDKIKTEYNNVNERFNENKYELDHYKRANDSLSKQIEDAMVRLKEAYEQRTRFKETIYNIRNSMDAVMSRIGAIKRERDIEKEQINNALETINEQIPHIEQPLLMDEDELIMEALSPRKTKRETQLTSTEEDKQETLNEIYEQLVMKLGWDDPICHSLRIFVQGDNETGDIKSLKHSMMQHTMNYLFSPNSKNVLPMDKQSFEYDERRAQETIKKSEQTIEWLDHVKQAWNKDEETALNHGQDDKLSMFLLNDQEKQALTACFMNFLKHELETRVYVVVQDILRQIQSRLNRLTKAIISLRVSIKSLDSQNRTLEHALEQSMDQQMVDMDERYRALCSNEANQRHHLEQKILQLEREKESIQVEVNHWIKVAQDIRATQDTEMISRDQDAITQLKARIISLETLYRKHYLKAAYWKLRCKRELGYRSDLVYQKKYLLLTISGLEAKEHVALTFLSQHKGARIDHEEASDEEQPERHFRVCVFGILAITRMKLFAHRTSAAMKSVLTWSPKDETNIVTTSVPVESAITVV